MQTNKQTTTTRKEQYIIIGSNNSSDERTHNKSSEVCIKTRSSTASLPFNGQVNEPLGKL